MNPTTQKKKNQPTHKAKQNKTIKARIMITGNCRSRPHLVAFVATLSFFCTTNIWERVPDMVKMQHLYRPCELAENVVTSRPTSPRHIAFSVRAQQRGPQTTMVDYRAAIAVVALFVCTHDLFVCVPICAYVLSLRCQLVAWHTYCSVLGCWCKYQDTKKKDLSIFSGSCLNIGILMEVVTLQ